MLELGAVRHLLPESRFGQLWQSRLLAAYVVTRHNMRELTQVRTFLTDETKRSHQVLCF